MTLESLLVTRDQQVIGVLRPAMEKLSIDVEVCRGSRSGNEILATEKFDAIIVDCDDMEGGLEVLRSLSSSASNKNSVTFAVLNGKTTTQAAFEMGAKFVLQKPISQLNATRCFSAALNFMVRERRRYFRHPVEIPTWLEFGSQKFEATGTNLSDGGMAIRFRGKLPNGGLSGVSFSVPDGTAVIEAKATIAWMDAAGRAGIRFCELPANARQLLDSWLNEQMLKMGLQLEDPGQLS